MKKLTQTLALVLVATLFSAGTFAQGKLYTSSGIENIFAFSNIESSESATPIQQDLRYTIAFNIQTNINYDFGNNFGVYSGLGIRNVGINYRPEGDYRIKQRAYSLGVPLGFKIGNLDKGIFFYGGAEYEWMFAYKEKRYVDGEKKIKREWFSDRLNSFVPSLYGGVSFANGISVSVKYYMDDFLNKDYTTSNTKPYANINSQMIYLSVGISLFEKDSEGSRCPIMQ